MKEFVFSADWHLAPSAWKKLAGVTGDSYYSLLQIIDYCIDRMLPLIAGGDLLDQKPQYESEALTILNRQLSRMQEAGLPVYFIQGQHEMQVRPWLSTHSWPTYIHRRMIDDIYGLDWTPRHLLSQAFADIPEEANVLVCHQVWSEHLGFEGKSEASIDDLPDRISLVLSGDYHRQRYAQYPIRDSTDRRMLVSPGSICCQEISEVPTKGFYVVRRNNEFDLPSLETVPLVTRTIRRVDLSSKEDIDRLLEQTVPELRQSTAILPPLLEVRYRCDLSGTSVLQNLETFPEIRVMLTPIPVEVTTVLVEPIETSTTASTTTNVQRYLEAMPVDDATLSADAARLLAAENPEVEFAAMEEEFLSNVARATGSGELLPISP